MYKKNESATSPVSQAPVFQPATNSPVPFAPISSVVQPPPPMAPSRMAPPPITYI